jgi:hypothetical protein
MSKNNVRDKEFPIMLDKERHLRLDLNAFCVLEEAHGDVFAILGNAEKGSLKALRAVVWVGLVHEDATLTEEAVGKMIDPSNLGEVAQTIQKAIAYYLPDPKNSQTPALDTP